MLLAAEGISRERTAVSCLAHMPLLGVCTLSPAPVTSSTQGWTDVTKKPENSPQDTWYEGPGMPPLTITLMLLRGSCMVTHRTETLPVLILR